MKELNYNYIWWGIIIVVAITIICFTTIIVVNSAYTINLNMDNNTLEAIKSINWSALPK